MTYVHAGLPILTKAAAKALSVSTAKIQAALIEKTDRQYDIRDLNDVIAQWLENSIEQLCEEACEMCVTGDRHNGAFNRQAFKNLLKKMPSSNIWEEKGAIAQLFEDQSALSLERAA
jgi:hypothetical protein